MATSTTKLRTMIAKALDTVTPTLRDVASWIDVSYGALRMYRAKMRTPDRATIRRLARALRSHADKVTKLADRLDAEAERHE